MKRLLTLLFLIVSTHSAISQLRVEVERNEGWIFTGDKNPQVVLNLSAKGDIKGDLRVDIFSDTQELIHRFTCHYQLQNDSTRYAFTFKASPGFYLVKILDNGTQIEEYYMGVKPEEIVSKVDAQEDFALFWDDAKKELKRVRPRYKLSKISSNENCYRDLYKVTMRSIGDEIIGGYLAVPKEVKRGADLPAFIHYMGYGAEPWEPNLIDTINAVDYIASVRGQGIFKQSNSYGDWIINNLGDRDTYYYRGAYMDVIRSIDFVSQLKYIDKQRIFAEGGSQGGAFTMVACALDNRIRAAAPLVTFLSDFPDYFAIAPWPANTVLNHAKEMGINQKHLYQTLSYFDIKNFAPMIECPIVLAVGLQDTVCPAHTVFAGYNLVKSEKSYVIFPEMGHNIDWTQWATFRDKFFAQYL